MKTREGNKEGVSKVEKEVGSAKERTSKQTGRQAGGGGKKTEREPGIDFIMEVCSRHAAPRIGVRQNRLLVPVDGNWVRSFWI